VASGLSRADAAWEAVLRRSPEEAIPAHLTGRWWVAHTKPRNEKALALDLRARGVFAYLPLSHRITHSAATQRASRSIVPVFAGYLFFNAGEEQRRRALTTNRIASTLEVADQRELVGQLRQIQRVLCTQTDFEWGPSLAEGDWARVVAGPLVGIEGIVLKRVKRARLALNVQMLSQSVTIEVDRDLLEKIDGPSVPRS
jgi:hypothetical protein